MGATARRSVEVHMKGVIFNLLEDVVRRERGEDASDVLLERTRLEGAFTSLGSYPDEQLTQLLVAACAEFGLSEEAVLRWFGRNAMPLLAERYPEFFRTQPTTRAFLLTLNHIIHPEVRKLYPGADVPQFDFDSSAPDVLRIGYRSRRRLCALARGFIDGAADLYHEQVTVHQVRCMHRGDEKCVLEVAFATPSSSCHASP
jgi:hypothetical protein